ncbi:MAG: response regulator [Rectinemataceae bacterium]
MPRILIADDEELEREALRFIIRSGTALSDDDIHEAGSGRAALELLKKGRYDVVFFDVMMPGMDGIAAVAGMRDAGIDTPVVILSAHDRFEYARDAMRLGVDEYLLKPASAAEVLGALGRCLAQSEEKLRLHDEERSRRAKIDSAEEFVLREMRSRLAECRLEPLTAAEFLAFFGLEGRPRAALCLRLARPESNTGSLRSAAGRAALAAAAETGASLLAQTGDRAIYGTGDTMGSMLLFPSSRSPGADAMLDAMRRAARDIAPIDLLAGLCGPSTDNPVILLSIAADACSLAIPGCPTVRLSVPASAASEFRSADIIAKGTAGVNMALTLAAKAVGLIRRRFQEDLSLEGVASELGASPSHLSRMIAKELGMGFSDFLTHLRMERAKELLLTGASVKEASLLVGYRDQAYFSRVFRKSEGTNPVDFLALTARKYRK